MAFRWPHPGKLARRVSAIALSIALLLFAFAWSGIYNVAASRVHWAAVEWLLSFGMRKSVERRAASISEPPLDDPNLIILGTAHFENGCAPCHGAPGRTPNPIAQSMLPAAPDLSASADRWRPRELFWIVKNGIKYTGMPGWTSQQRDDEVWALVAFVQALPRTSETTYASIVRAPGGAAGRTDIERLADERCGACHGRSARQPPTNLVPTLNGQPAAFLADALRVYANGTRESGIMQPIANDLTAAQIEGLADYYAALPPSRSSPPAVSNDEGARLATVGAPDAGLPACLSCHGVDALPTYPRLAGQSAAYIAAQLHLLKNERAPRAPGRVVMAPIAQKLTARQIDDVAAYLSALEARH